MPKKDYDKIHRANVDIYARKIQAIYDSAIKEAAAIGSTVPNFDPSKPFSFSDYPITHNRVKKLSNELQNNIEAVVLNGIKHEWTLSNNKNNELCNRVFGDNVGKLTKEQYRRYYSNNGKAADAFKARKVAGLNLSERVWKYSDQFKTEIEFGIDLDLRDGISAADMARNLKQYLQNPDKLFRRVRDEHGQLHLSKAAKAFKPGQGVYRSSVKNAQRLARTETNMAYHTADHERWQQFDFVVGVEVRTSNNHPVSDICDTLAGKYPKDFKFTGWHPQCRCHAVPILKTIEELNGDTERIINGLPTNTESVNTVNQMPDSFTSWIEGNKERFGATNTPYFIRDNFKDGKIAEGFSFATGINKQIVNNIIVPKPLSIQERADIRHKNRTEEQTNDIQDRWDERKVTVIMGDKPIDSIIEVQGVMDRFFKAYPEETNAKAITVGIYKQASKKGSFSIMHADSPAGIIEFNNVCYPHLKDSPYTRLKVALNKIKNKTELTFDEEYSIESFYHEILHCKAKQWERLKKHNKGDYKRTAMEIVNQFVSRHEYKSFIERLGGKALHQQQVLDNGMGYSDWVGGFRDFIKAAGLKEDDACAYFKDKLLNSKYGELDDVLAGFIKQNSGNLLSGYSKEAILECLESGGSKWEFIIDLVKDKNKP